MAPTPPSKSVESLFLPHRHTNGGITKRPSASKAASTTSSSTSLAPPPITSDLKDKLTSVVSVTTRGASSDHAKTVTLHTSLLAQKSSYLYGLCRESSSGDGLKLLDLDSSAFGIFAAWVYSGTVAFDLSSEGGVPDRGDILASVLECYVLSARLQALDFANDVLSAACKTSEQHGLVFRNAVIQDMYRRTVAGSGLRKWMVDEWVWQYDNECVGELEWEESKSLCREFLFDVVKAQARRIGRKAKVCLPFPGS